MANIGDLVVNLDANTRGLERGMRRGRDQLDNINTGMQRTMGIARRLTGVLGALGLSIGLTQAVREIADFQTALNGLAATSNATAEQMEALESQARELGATSRFSAQQAAEGQRFLAQAGFSVNEVMGATPGILQLATAAELDLGTAADIASNVLGGMRLEVDQLNRVNDVLAATASRSNTNIQQLGQALSFAAPFAAGAGISIEEAAAAIGTMSDAGIQASRAGTGLVGTIRQLSNVTNEGEKVLDKYSLSVSDVNIEARGLGPVLETLRAANLSTADAIALFGSEAGAAAQVLVNDYSGGIEGAEGEAARMAEQLNRGLTPAFRSLGSAVSESVLQMGDSGMAGALEGLIRSATGVISVWNGMGDEWAEANGVGQTSLGVIEGVSQALAVLAAAAGARAAQALITLAAAKAGLTSASITLTGALTGLRTVAMTLFGPLGLLAGAAALVFQFRDELGMVAPEAATVAEELDEITTSLEGMSNAMLDVQRAAFGAELLQMNIRAQELQSELEELQRQASDPQAGAGPALRARMGGGDVERELQGIEARREAIGQAMEGLDAFRTASDDAAEGADSLSESTNNAASALDEFSARLTPEVEDILERAGPGATIDAEGQIRDAWGNTLPTLQRQLEDELQGQVNAFSAEQNLMKGLEEAAKRFTDESETAAKQAFGSIEPSSQNAVREAMQESKNIGSLTFKLESADGTSETDVEGDADDLRRLANLFSGVASAV